MIAIIKIVHRLSVHPRRLWCCPILNGNVVDSCGSHHHFRIGRGTRTTHTGTILFPSSETQGRMGTSFGCSDF